MGESVIAKDYAKYSSLKEIRDAKRIELFKRQQDLSEAREQYESAQQDVDAIADLLAARAQNILACASTIGKEQGHEHPDSLDA